MRINLTKLVSISDTAGNRTVKEHLGVEAVWVNGTKAGVKTDSMEYSIYPSPYLSITGNRWTKHYYIGSERIASRTGTLGDFAALHTSDNQSAGNGQVASVNYAAIRQVEEDSIASYYAQLGVPYELQHNTRGSGIHLYLPTSLLEDNRGNSTANEGTTGERDRDSLRNTPTTLDGGQVYYYHRDPLGSTLSVSDSVGTLVQQVEYTPWGEVFVELRVDSTFATPYLFNGKELDEETGLYYYGARYYDPKLCVWYSTDRDQEKYPYVSSYCYTLSNPINAIDPNGELVIFINGFHTGDGGKADYWEGLNERIMQKLNDYHQRYYDGSMGGAINTITHGIATGNLNPMKRFKHGVLMGSSDAENIFASLKKNETIKIFTHSMGAAYGKGFILGLQIYAKVKGIDIKNLIEFEVDLAPFQSLMQLPAKGVKTVSIGHYWDGIAGPSFMPFAENHNTRFDKFSLNPIKEHSIDSFTINEINTYLPNVNGPKIMNKRIWEQHGTKDEK